MIALVAPAFALVCGMTPTQLNVREQLGKAKLEYRLGLPEEIGRSVEASEHPLMPIDLVGEPKRRSGWVTQVSTDPTAPTLGVTLIQRDGAGGLFAEAGTLSRVGTAYAFQATMKGACKLVREKDSQ